MAAFSQETLAGLKCCSHVPSLFCLVQASRAFQAKLLSEVPQLVLVGRPDMCVVAFAAKQPRKLNVYQLNDALTARGWHLNALQVRVHWLL